MAGNGGRRTYCKTLVPRNTLNCKMRKLANHNPFGETLMKQFSDFKPKQNIYYGLENALYPYRREIIGTLLIVLTFLAVIWK